MRLMANTHAYGMKTKPEQPVQATVRDAEKEASQFTVLNEDEGIFDFPPEEDLFDFTWGAVSESEASEETNEDSSPFEDASRRLTRQLVAASTQFEVQLIVGEAHQHIGKLRMAALSGDEETIKAANAIIRKLEKLVRRGNRKLTDLGKEDVLRREQKRAEQAEMIQRSKQIEAELKRKLAERKNREEKYLRDKDDDDEDSPFEIAGNNGSSNSNVTLDVATEAKIAAQAKAMAAVEVSASQFASSGAAVSAGAVSSAHGAASAGGAGGEAGAVSGAEGAESGSIDIAV